MVEGLGLFKRRYYIFEMWNPGRCVNFNDKSFGVAVDDQPGQTVVLAVDEAIAVRLLFSERRADYVGCFYFFLKPVRINGSWFYFLQNAHADRRGGVIQTDGEKAALVIEDHGKVAGVAFAALLGDGLIENPGMSLL